VEDENKLTGSILGARFISALRRSRSHGRFLSTCECEAQRWVWEKETV